MIDSLRRRFFTVHYEYANPTMRQRAQGLILMIWAALAFIALFVGLGVDFGIQFSVRYRAERFHYPDLSKALCHTGRSVGLPTLPGSW